MQGGFAAKEIIYWNATSPLWEKETPNNLVIGIKRFCDDANPILSITANMMYVKQKIALHIVPNARVTRRDARPDQTPADLFRDIGGLYVNNYFKPLSVDGLVKSQWDG